MSGAFRPAGGWGEGRHRAALSVTFDNFGEAAEIETGRYTDGEIGSHHTATFLPRLAALLGDVRATYFMEASNAAIYPDVIRAWHAAGHEVALHGWRHEMWLQTAPERRQALLAQSMTAMRGIGIDLVGFRPPGGGMPDGAWTELREAGLRYCSAAGPQGVTLVDGIVSLPFEWQAVDAYVLEPVLGFLRVMMGDPEAPSTIAQWDAKLDGLLAATLAAGEHRTLIFHPEFLGLAEDKLDVLRRFLDRVRQHDVWLAPAGDVAAFVARQLDTPIMQAA